MRKLNNRTIFFACVSACFGIVLSSYETYWKIAAVFALFCVFAVLVYINIENGDCLPKVFTALFMLAFFILGICGGYAQQIIYSKMYQEQSGVIKCEIVEVSQTQFVGKNLIVEGESISGRILVTFDGSDEYEVGDVVAYIGDITPIPIFENGVLNYQFSSGITYRSEAYEIEESYHNFTFYNYLKSAIYSAQEEMFGENIGIAYAMTFGDTAFVDYSSLSLLRRGGIAHIFAVSGLHIGILYGLLRMFSWLKLRSSLKEKAVFKILCLLVLLFYVYLCDFTASSVRAFLMIAVGMILTRIGQVGDRLHTISIAAFIIMLYSPYIIFTVGFQLSFLTVLGLAIFPSKIEKHIRFLKNQKIIKAVAFAFSAFISTALVSCYHFGYVSTISALLNLLIVPIYSLVYVANLIGLGIYGICKLLSFEYIIDAICPYFTNVIYDKTIEIFTAIETAVPLAFYFTIPIGIVVACHGVMYAYSGLVSEVVNKTRRLAFCGVFCFVCCTPVVLSSITIDRPGIVFYQTSSQDLTIETDTATYIFCKSGGEIDFSNIETNTVHVVIYDDFYQDMQTTGGEGLDINLYSTFLGETPMGAKSLFDFQDMNGEVVFLGYRTVEYQGVKFVLAGDSVYVIHSQGTWEFSSNGYEYYIIDGVFTNNISSETSR